MWSNIRPSHVSVRTCEQWQHGCLDLDAVWVVSGVGLGMGVLDFGGDRRRGRGSLGVNLRRPIVTKGDFVGSFVVVWNCVQRSSCRLAFEFYLPTHSNVTSKIVVGCWLHFTWPTLYVHDWRLEFIARWDCRVRRGRPHNFRPLFHIAFICRFPENARQIVSRWRLLLSRRLCISIILYFV